MNEAPSPLRRRRIARILVGLFGAGAVFAGIGISTFSTVPSTPNTFVPCQGDVCVACLDPSLAQCAKLLQCGGEPCPSPMPGDVDLYAGPAGRLARGLREAKERGAIETWTTRPAPPVLVDGGFVSTGDCMPVLKLDRDQRAAFLHTVDGVASGSKVVDCRVGSMPAKGRNGAGRGAVFGGMDPSSGAVEATPEDAVGTLDAGPE